MYEVAIRKLEAAIRQLEKSVLETPPPDLAQFREVVGRYRGLREAVDILYGLMRDDDSDSDPPEFE